jgi:hypothetical protein
VVAAEVVEGDEPPAEAWVPPSSTAALEEFVYDDLDDADVLEGGGGGGGGGEGED